VVVCWSTMKPSLVIRQWQQALYTFTCHYNGLFSFCRHKSPLGLTEHQLRRGQQQTLEE